MTRGFVVTRLAIAIVISFCGLLARVSARAQSDQSTPPDASPSRQLTIAPREALETVACEGGAVTAGLAEGMAVATGALPGMVAVAAGPSLDGPVGGTVWLCLTLSRRPIATKASR